MHTPTLFKTTRCAIVFLLISVGLIACGGGSDPTGAEELFTGLPIVTKWKIDNVAVTGSSAADQLTINTEGGGYNFTVDWGDGNIESGLTGDVTHSYTGVDVEYTVIISGSFPRIVFGNSGDYKDYEKLLSVENWGETPFTSMEDAFVDCVNLVVNATDAPDLSGVTNMSRMFERAKKLNQNISHWDVSGVTDMSLMFYDAILFNQPLGYVDATNPGWDVSNVTNMYSMFYNADKFNQNINSWTVTNVTNMEYMFGEAIVFNKPLTSWDVSSVTNMGYMFYDAKIFNQALTGWNVSSVTNMAFMFAGAHEFNQPLTGWNVSAVTDMQSMFKYAWVFNQNISGWDVSSVTNMAEMFRIAFQFNQPIGSWNVSAVTDMDHMFFNALNFNQMLGLNGGNPGWDVSSVTNMTNMFHTANALNSKSFSSWNVTSVGPGNHGGFLSGANATAGNTEPTW